MTVAARARLVGAGLAAAWLGLTLLALRHGSADDVFRFSGGDLWRALRATVGLGEPLAIAHQTVFELRLWSALCAGGVGACLAASGAMLQGLFRNGLAEPALIGTSGGANLGATLAILLLSGYSTGSIAADLRLAPAVAVTAAAFLGALGITAAVLVLASRRGSVASVPHMLLLGVAMNTVILGVLTAVQSLVLADVELTRALRTWTFGSIEDRGPGQVGMALAGTLACALAIPRLRTELDLMAGGDDDAAALGVDVGRTRLLLLCTAAFATASAFAVAGQIAFVGLVVPHALRLLGLGASHRTLLPLSLLGGPVLLLGCDLVQLAILGERRLGAGVLMSVIGGPLFVALLASGRRATAW